MMMGSAQGMTESREGRGPRILTTYAKNRHPAWISRVELLEEWHEEVRRTWKKPLSEGYRLRRDLVWACRIYRAGQGYDAIVTGSDRAELLSAVIERFFGRRRPRHVFIDWYCDLPAGPSRWWRRRLLRWAALAGARILVQSGFEVKAYANALRLPPAKFVFVPYHATLYDTPYTVTDGNYIFAGGDSDRDYRPLLEAARTLPTPVRIAVLRHDHFRGLEIPNNVQIFAASHQEFVGQMAGAAIVVVSMKGGLLHAGGQQTWLNAMTMGKPVVVAHEAADGYIQDHVTGILVPPGDSMAMTSALRELLDNPELARRIGERAKQASAAFTPEKFLERVFGVVDECLGQDRSGVLLGRNPTDG